MPTATKRNKPAPDRYLEWIQEFPLRPIRSDRELQGALAVIDRLGAASDAARVRCGDAAASDRRQGRDSSSGCPR